MLLLSTADVALLEALTIGLEIGAVRKFDSGRGFMALHVERLSCYFSRRFWWRFSLGVPIS